nr:MAG TPA: hypothetical protein [Caudoviricetes sp.]
MKWIKQTFCMHSVIKTTDEEMEKTGYLFKCSKCGKYLPRHIHVEMWDDARFWIGVLCGILMFDVMIRTLLIILKGAVQNG